MAVVLALAYPYIKATQTQKDSLIFSPHPNPLSSLPNIPDFNIFYLITNRIFDLPLIALLISITFFSMTFITLKGPCWSYLALMKGKEGGVSFHIKIAIHFLLIRSSLSCVRRIRPSDHAHRLCQYSVNNSPDNRKLFAHFPECQSDKPWPGSILCNVNCLAHSAALGKIGWLTATGNKARKTDGKQGRICCHAVLMGRCGGNRRITMMGYLY